MKPSKVKEKDKKEINISEVSNMIWDIINKSKDIKDIEKQIEYLKGEAIRLEKLFYNSLLSEFNNLSKNLKNKIEKEIVFYDDNYRTNFSTINETDIHLNIDNRNLLILNEFTGILWRFNPFFHSIDGISKSKNEIISNLKKDLVFIITNKEYNELETLAYNYKYSAELFHTVDMILRAKRDYIIYKKRNKQYEFEFQHYLSIDYIMEFVRLLESYKQKLSYLKFEYNNVIPDFDEKTIQAEIDRIQDILETENKNPVDVLREPKLSENNLTDKPEISKKNIKTTEKELNKFQSSTTQINVVLLFNILIKAGFFYNTDKIGAILKDTFLTEEGNSFENQNINVVKKKIDKNVEKKAVSFKNIQLQINPSGKDYTKFQRLRDLLNELIPS